MVKHQTVSKYENDTNQNTSASHIELYKLMPERKTSDCWIKSYQILTLRFQFDNLYFIIMYMFTQGYLS